ncbi:glycosyltransferase family 4 protein [Curtobacterium sp. RHCJP20]|uniref:D-inositol 3-phosphate glycosyltransferase n=1 Tax=Curtobacterium subtropicum TaxID=3055138 RepID=A0ABT7TM16_9MICO|nr:glycosyltransferase family 4 protein [Curtobacterium subtropicum]MDM7889934.1 glycosyltransferase family 4 protein [Curtobacterium subtropicum]
MTRPATPIRVTVVTQYYPPEMQGWIPASVARGLAERGHDVTVVTAFPNYPFGKVFPGWKQRLGHVEQDGDVTVHRVPIVPDHSDRAVRRIVNCLSFAASSITATRAARRADVVYVHSAQPTAAIGPMLWRRLFGTPYVLHVQDVWPESVTGSGIVQSAGTARVMRTVLLAWLRRLHRSAAHVIAIAPGAARLLVDRGSRPDRTSTIVNWAMHLPDPAARAARSDDGTTTIVYAGNLGPNQGLDAVVHAAARCADLPGLHFRFVGDGLAADRLRALASDLGAPNISFEPPVGRDQMPAVHSGADFEIVALADAPMSPITIPSKLQDAMANGVPVIAALPGDAADLVSRGSAGLVARPGDVDAIETAFRAAHATGAPERERLAVNARAVVRTHMRPDAAIDRIEQILREAAR